MAHEFDVDALGVALRVEVSGLSGTDFRRLRGQWRRTRWTGGGRPDAAGVEPPTATIRAALGEYSPGADVSGRDFDELSVRLRQAINLRAIEVRREELLTLHAAGLADTATGDVIALIGPSGAGKTTAAKALGTALGYVSDETVAVDAAGAVLPFPKPLAVKPGGSAAPKRLAGPDALRLREVRGPLRLTRIALLERSESAVAPTVTTAPLAEVLDSIVLQTSYFAALPRALSRLEALVRACGGVRVIRYHDAADLLEPVSALLERSADRPATVEAVALSPMDDAAELADAADHGGGVTAGSFTRARVDDWIDTDGEIVVLAGERMSRLSPISSLLWRSLGEPRSLGELAELAETTFGPAPGRSSREAVAAVLDELVRDGFVRALRSSADDVRPEAAGRADTFHVPLGS